MRELSDQELFKLISLSDAEAFNELYNRHWKYIYTIAYRKTGDKDDAFDVAQSVFIDFYDKRETLVINIPLKNFLRTATIYKLARHFRDSGLKEKHYQNFRKFCEQAQLSADTLDSIDIKEAKMAFEEIIDAIYTVIDEMPPKMKEIFLMSRNPDHSISSIADQLAISPQTVKNQISTALSRIRKALDIQAISYGQMLFIIWLINT